MSKQWLKQPAFIQSFAPTSLIYISNQTDLPKIFLIDDTTTPTQDTNQVFIPPHLASTVCDKEEAGYLYVGMLNSKKKKRKLLPTI